MSGFTLESVAQRRAEMDSLIDYVVEIPEDPDLCFSIADMSYGEPGMRARVSRTFQMRETILGPRFGHLLYYVELDYEPFSAHNIPLETDDFQDENGHMTTMRKAGLYTGRDVIEVNPDDPLYGLKVMVKGEATQGVAA